MLIYVDLVKEFYAKMTIIHLKTKDVVKSSVKGISIEFDHEQCVAILDVHWKKLEYVNTSRRCGKSRECDSKIWEERHFKLHGSTYMDHLMARRLVDTPRVMMRHMSYVISMKDHESLYGDWLTFVFEAFGVPLVVKKGEEPKDMTTLKKPSSQCVGESGSDDQFYDAQVEVEEPVMKLKRLSDPDFISSSAEGTSACGVDPRAPSRTSEAEFLKFQAEFERKRANRFHDDLEKAKAENARLQPYSTKPKPNPILRFPYLTEQLFCTKPV
ncbi:hypothetical protein Dimus_036565 [Dionaea muscipula]